MFIVFLLSWPFKLRGFSSFLSPGFSSSLLLDLEVFYLDINISNVYTQYSLYRKEKAIVILWSLDLFNH